jgi:hypothetical protein
MKYLISLLQNYTEEKSPQTLVKGYIPRNKSNPQFDKSHPSQKKKRNPRGYKA